MLRQTKRPYLDVADLKFSVAQFRVALLTVLMGCLFATPLTHADVLAVNTGKYRSGGTVIDVPCELIGTGRLRYPPKARKFRYVGQVIVGFSVAKDVLFASTSQDIQNRPVNLRNMVRPKTS